jgi:D-sedoheptulose 7-phosphate isomerase
MSLTDNAPYMLAWANDEGYERVFVEQLKNFAEPGALLVAISGSGNSPNVLRAVEYANQHGMRTFGVTGFDGGRLKRTAQQSLHVPSTNMGAVEAVHDVVFHYLVEALYREFRQETGSISPD